jgi:ATP-dependent HslUV protease ATP-binding subunit HslU
MNLLPTEISAHLDQFVIGQHEAKEAIAVALRNRWRRLQLTPEQQKEIPPRNILMIGPTGVGKTELARRIAKLTDAPFIKVEATKFTEVGYVGGDVESIIRNLTDIAINSLRQKESKQSEAEVLLKAENIILEALYPTAKNDWGKKVDAEKTNAEKEHRRELLKSGVLDDRQVEIDNKYLPRPTLDALPADIRKTMMSLEAHMEYLGQRPVIKTKLSVKEALPQIQQIVKNNVTDPVDLKQRAIAEVEQKGIVFIDEIDKICGGSNHSGGPSREGVQRDLLPIIEGCTVMTEHGPVNTDHILFIASGAFQLAKPSDLIAELQGRLPIRVQLKELTVGDFETILRNNSNSILEQSKLLLKTDGVDIVFEDSAITEIASMAYQLNKTMQNIGARRLAALIERLISTISYNVSDYAGKETAIDYTFVTTKLGDLIVKEDLQKYIL